MLHIFNWPAEPEKPRKADKRALERSRRFEAQLARSYDEMRARRESAKAPA